MGTLEEKAEPMPQPEQPLADRPAVPNIPPPGEQPFELDRPKPGEAGDRAAERRADRTQEIVQDMQAEARSVPMTSPGSGLVWQFLHSIFASA